MTSVSAPQSLKGAALEPRYYLDPDSVEHEQERIFDRTWQFAGHVSQLREPGAYLTTKAGTQPVLVIRDDEGEVRAFRNVCRHRGSRLLSGAGQCKRAIRCRYHGWTYRLDGTLIGVPEGRSFDAPLDKPGLGLFPVRSEVVEGLIFVNLDVHAEPLRHQLGELPARLARYGIADLDLFFELDRTQPVNWKIVADNYLEGYHVPIAHPGLMRLLDYGRYEADVHERWVWFEAPLRDKPSGNRLERAYQRLVTPMPGVSEEDRRVWRYIFVWPNTAIDLYPDQVSTWKMGFGGLSVDRGRLPGLPVEGLRAAHPRRSAHQPPPERDDRRRGRRPRPERPGGDAHDGLPARPAVAARGRRAVVRGAGARRPLDEA